MLKGWEVLYDQQEVNSSLLTMAVRIAKVHHEVCPLVLVAILKGGLWTAYHLAEKFGLIEDVMLGHLGISSYGNGRRPDHMTVTSYIDLPVGCIRDSDVWVVDDIFDTGGTMSQAISLVQTMNPRFLRTATLVHRITDKTNNSPTISGFEYSGDAFLAGCGMGVGENYRHFNEIYIVPDTKVGE